MDGKFLTLKGQTLLGLAPYMRSLVSKAMDEAYSIGERAGREKASEFQYRCTETVDTKCPG